MYERRNFRHDYYRACWFSLHTLFLFLYLYIYIYIYIWNSPFTVTSKFFKLIFDIAFVFPETICIRFLNLHRRVFFHILTTFEIDKEYDLDSPTHFFQNEAILRHFTSRGCCILKCGLTLHHVVAVFEMWRGLGYRL